MPNAPKGTKCDYGGSGDQRRKGCTLPAKTGQRAFSPVSVLDAVHDKARASLDETAAAAVRSEFDDGRLRKLGSGFICDACKKHALRDAEARIAVLLEERTAAAAAAARSSTPLPPAPSAAVRRLDLGREGPRSVSIGGLLTGSLQQGGWECELQTELQQGVFLSLSGRDGGNLARTCKTLAESAGWPLLQQKLCPPLARLMADLKAARVERQEAEKEAGRNARNLESSRSHYKLGKEAMKGALTGGRDGLTAQLKRRSEALTDDRDHQKQMREQAEQRLRARHNPAESTDESEEDEDEDELLRPEGKRISLDGRSPAGRPFLKCCYRTELARKKSQEGIAFDKALHSLVKARQSSGEIVVGLASPAAEDPTAGEWVSTLCTIEAAEWYNIDQAWRLYVQRNPGAELPLEAPVRDESWPRRARLDAAGGPYAPSRDAGPLSYEDFVRRPLQRWAEETGEPAELRRGDGQLVQRIPSQQDGRRTLREYVRRSGRQSGIKEVMVPACIGRNRQSTGNYAAQDAFSSISGRNAVTNMFGGKGFTKPGLVELVTLEENFGLNGGTFDAVCLEEAMYQKRCEIQALTDCDPGDLPTVCDIICLMSDGCPVITGQRKGSLQKMEAVRSTVFSVSSFC